jgi:hypothetical protein
LPVGSRLAASCAGLRDWPTGSAGVGIKDRKIELTNIPDPSFDETRNVPFDKTQDMLFKEGCSSLWQREERWDFSKGLHETPDIVSAASKPAPGNPLKLGRQGRGSNNGI